MLFAIILFALTYVLMMVLSEHRAYVALGSAAIFIVSGILPVSDILPSINFNVLMMLTGTMGIVFFFIRSNMPMRLADMLLKKVPNTRWAVVALAVFSGLISAFMDNVATVLMVAPVAMAITKRLKINPVPVIISIAVASNLQGAATLVGDTTSILLGGYAGMSFIDFFIYKGKIGLFFIVQTGAILSSLVLLWLFRKERQPISSQELTPVSDYFPSWLLLGLIVLLIAASFIPDTPDCINGVICMSLFVIGLIRAVIKEGIKIVPMALKDIDWQTILLLTGLFVVIGGITAAGVIDALAELISGLCSGNLFLIYTVLVWVSVVFSAFVDNIPYVATMLPVVQGIALSMGADPTVLYFGLLCGATLGGNLTPIGASANITGIGILKKEGCTVKNSDFFRIGIPFTLSAIIPAYILVWLLFA